MAAASEHGGKTHTHTYTTHKNRLFCTRGLYLLWLDLFLHQLVHETHQTADCHLFFFPFARFGKKKKCKWCRIGSTMHCTLFHVCWSIVCTTGCNWGKTPIIFRWGCLQVWDGMHQTPVKCSGWERGFFSSVWKQCSGALSTNISKKYVLKKQNFSEMVICSQAHTHAEYRLPTPACRKHDVLVTIVGGFRLNRWVMKSLHSSFLLPMQNLFEVFPWWIDCAEFMKEPIKRVVP